MPISGNWTKDKQKMLTSLEDLNLIHLDKVTYTDRSEDILASFENMRAGDIESGGWVLPCIYDFSNSVFDLYDAGDPTTIDNYPGSFTYDTDFNKRIYFQIMSSNFQESAWGEAEFNGNSPNAGELITITGPLLSGEFRVHKSTLINIFYEGGSYTQIPGRIWLKNTNDDPEHGVDWINDYGEGTFNHQWASTDLGWTESEITINKADIWGRDAFTPST